MITPSPMWGAIELAIVLVLILLSVPIAFAMGVTAVVFAWLFFGVSAGSAAAAITAWTLSHSYVMTMVPLFVFMGYIVAETGLGANAYDCFYKWLYKLKGSLGIISTISCAMFGAITGSSVAAIAAIGSIAWPEMEKYGYSRELQAGTLANAGILAALIPPSGMAIYYSILTDTSVGAVFIAGFIPGIILTALYSLTIYVWVTLRPSVAPMRVEERFSFKEKVVSLRYPLPIVALFIIMIGGIYTGIFSPTEAAGIGAVAAIVLTLIMRRLTWQSFKNTLGSSLRIAGYVMLAIMGAYLFSYTTAVSQFPKSVAGIVLGLEYSPTVVMALIMLIFIILGTFVSVLPLVVLFTPIFFPLVMELGYDAVWFGTVVVVLAEMATITPPVASHIYLVQAVEPKFKTGQIIRGIVPFYPAILILLVLLLFFPQIALWLPSTMRG